MRGDGAGKLKVDVFIHAALVFFMGMAIGAAVTYFGFEGSSSAYRKAEFKGQKLDIQRYMQILEDDKMTDTEVRETLRKTIRNKVQYFNDMEQKIVD